MVHGKYTDVPDDPRKGQPATGLLQVGDDLQARAQVAAALEWARQLYGTTLRQDGVQVMTHAYDVARNVSRFGRQDVELTVAALLHDVLETTDTSAGEIERRFGPRVAHLVVTLTNEPGEEPALSAQRAVQAGPDALLLRLCDRLEGVRRSPGRDPKSRRRFLAATREVYLPLAAEHFPAIAEEMREALNRAGRTLAYGPGSGEPECGDD